MKAARTARRQPAALATGALFAAALGLTAAQRAHAQSQQIENNLVPTQVPCSSCERSVAQAPVPAAPQTLPATPAPQPSFRLNDLRLNGAQALTAADLQSVTKPYIGRNVTLGDLEQLARDITALYKSRGYFLAQAVVPVQTVQDGVVEISIIEGRMGKLTVNVAPDAPISPERVNAFLVALKAGVALDSPNYERAMLLLSDQPGIRVTSALEEGTVPGTTDLSVEVVAGPRWAFAVDADNHGTLESGRYRIGGTARWNSPFGIGDNMDMRLMASDSSGMWFGRASYEAPIGSSGLRAGVGVSRVQYQLGGDYVALDAHGTADVLDFSLNYPVIRSRQQNLFVRLAADGQDLSDHYDGVGYVSTKRIRGLGFGWTWELRDSLLGGGYWASSGSYYHGRLDIRDALTEQLDQSDFGRHTEGGFDKLTFQFSRLQSIIERNSLYLSIGGQWANKNLDASQKLSLGGARAVRAYPSGELLVDEGYIGTVEWRWSYNEQWTPFVFYDAARGKIAQDPAVFDLNNTQSLRGYGIGVSWAQAGNFSINATLAWRDGTREAVTDGGGHNPRLFVQLQKAF